MKGKLPEILLLAAGLTILATAAYVVATGDARQDQIQYMLLLILAVLFVLGAVVHNHIRLCRRERDCARERGR